MAYYYSIEEQLERINEIMVTTDREISDEELDSLLKHFSEGAVCTDKWSKES